MQKGRQMPVSALGPHTSACAAEYESRRFSMNYSDCRWRLAECRGLAPLARRHALVSTEARSACPVDIPDWSAWGDSHSQGCSGLSRTGLLFPINHTPVGAPGLAPGRLSDLKSLGSAVPSEARRRELVGMKGIAPPCLPDSESGPSAVRV